MVTSCGIATSIIVFILLGWNYINKKTMLWKYSKGFWWKLIELLVRTIVTLLPDESKGGDMIGADAWTIPYIPGHGFIEEPEGWILLDY